MDEDFDLEDDQATAWRMTWVDPASWLVVAVHSVAAGVCRVMEAANASLACHAAWQKERDDFRRDAGRVIEQITSGAEK